MSFRAARRVHAASAAAVLVSGSAAHGSGGTGDGPREDAAARPDPRRRHSVQVVTLGGPGPTHGHTDSVAEGADIRQTPGVSGEFPAPPDAPGAGPLHLDGVRRPTGAGPLGTGMRASVAGRLRTAPEPRSTAPWGGVLRPSVTPWRRAWCHICAVPAGIPSRRACCPRLCGARRARRHLGGHLRRGSVRSPGVRTRRRPDHHPGR